MKRVVLGCLIFLGVGALLRAGSVATITDGSEATGTVVLTPTGVHVDSGSSPIDVPFTDVLAANFADTPLQLDSFYGAQDGGTQLPASWKAQDIGKVAAPGSVTETGGTFTLHGSGATAKPGDNGSSDNLFFAGRPWNGNGEWTARVSSIDAATPDTSTGLMLRSTLDAGSPLFLLEAMSGGNGSFAVRPEANKPWQAGSASMDLPVWLRVTRFGSTFYASTSTDGLEWDYIWQNNLTTPATPLIGLFADSHKDKVVGTAVIDQVAFTPAPSTAQLLPSGVLLQSGTFLAGSFNSCDFHPAKAGTNASFNLDGKPVEIGLSKIAAITILPTTRAQLASMGTHVGLVMKNGDFMDGDPESINGSSVVVSSIALGLTTYNQSEVRACVLHPLADPTADYEVRLRNGSIIYATAVGGDKDAAVIQEVSGLTINVTADELAEFRAGPASTQSLAELDWKVITPPDAAPDAPAPGAPATAANPPPAPAAIPDQLQPVQCWSGNNGEQIIRAPIRTALQFNLKGQFRALAMRVAAAPDSPPNSSVTVRVLADGREITTPSSVKVGEPPRFLEIPLQSPHTLLIEGDSAFAGPKILFIDPVLLRDKGA